MELYITVLDLDLAEPKWKAIQVDDTMNISMKNLKYNANMYKLYDKKDDDLLLGNKNVIENSTGIQGAATIIKINEFSFQNFPKEGMSAFNNAAQYSQPVIAKTDKSVLNVSKIKMDKPEPNIPKIDNY